MREMIGKLIEPKKAIPEERKIFSDMDLKKLIVPLFLEQLLAVLVGVADTFMVSYAGEADVSGVSLVNMFNTVFIYSPGRWRCGGGQPVYRQQGSRERQSVLRAIDDGVSGIFHRDYGICLDFQ